MKRRLPRSLAPLLVLPLLAGCSVEPPVPLEEDPEFAGWGAGPAVGLRVAVAPVRVARDEAPEAWPAASAAVVASDASPGAWPERDYASDVAASFDRPQLQRRLTKIAGWSLGAEPLLLEGGASSGAVREAAEQAQSDILVQLDLLQARAAWIERDGAWWWGDLFLFWGLGIPPALLISDEVYEVDLRARLQVIEVRSGRALLQRTFRASASRALSHPQRGWSVGGLLWLHPYTLDDEDFASVSDALLPHALKDLERQVAATLASGLRPMLGHDALGQRIRSGSFGPRSFALVVGVDGPQGGAPPGPARPTPLSGAATDAGAFAAHLVESGEVLPANRVVLQGPAATGERVCVELRALARRARASDRLIVYYAGFGSTDERGAPAWVLADGPLALAGLTDELAGALPRGARVDLVMDSSFGVPAAGRSWPGGAELAPGSLPALVSGRAWRLLVAASEGEAAVEHKTPTRGLFSEWLLTAASGAGDGDDDGVLSMEEAAAFLGRWVPGEANEAGAAQHPRLYGAGADAPFLKTRVQAKPAAPAPAPPPAPGSAGPADGAPPADPAGIPEAPARAPGR
ncbi:MAG: hypothetical protein AB7N76_04170 [Planctomycetota bacterium]